ncbi:tetratricopeptide repeat protein [Roseateles chitosanitabidus]|uniref:tetratricopeptide repeat protein n=1 Tax=Roseateles chitosanitabidus TaxID=65048 RepID=UPI000A84B61F|nr:tetratricopeptide repeat protein [Roseateles chitosanitabidus]
MDASPLVASARTLTPRSLRGRDPRSLRRRLAQVLSGGRVAALGVAAVAVMALSACSTPPTARTDQVVLVHDELFAPTTDRIDPEEVMAITPQMREFIHTKVPRLSGLGAFELRDARNLLLEALYTKGDLQLEYDAEETRTAAEAFDARSGNCLSLAMMTAVFAREIGVPVLFRQIYEEEQWSRVGDLQVVSGHVNIALGRRPNAFRVVTDEEPSLVVDFLPGAKIRAQRAITLDERTIVAMYLNNRAAELMSQSQLDRAYWWARAAWLHDPRLLTSLNTLGVIYRRHGHPALAETAFRGVLQREPANTQAMSNLASLLRSTGQLADAKQVEDKLAQLQPYPPFKFFDLGVAEMKAGHYAAARDFFAKEISRSAYYHEFHFWMAMANVGLGDWDAVRKELAMAQEYSTTNKQRQLYTAKLDSLKAKMPLRGSKSYSP